MSEFYFPDASEFHHNGITGEIDYEVVLIISEAGFYKKFPVPEGINVEELIDWQIKRLKKIFDSGDGGIMRP